MATHSLGDFTFVNFHMPGDPAAGPEMIQEETNITQRPGVDGTGVFLLGKKGRPFPMRSFVDVELYSQAGPLVASYYIAVGGDEGPSGREALTLVWNGIDYFSEFGVKYIPLRLESYRIRRITTAVGGLNDNPEAAVEAIWTLQPVFAES